MDAETTKIDSDRGRRLADAIARVEGVGSVVVCSRDGEVAGSNGSGDPAREAALAAFIAYRAEALVADSDLRGLGRTLAGSHLEQAALAGPGGEALIFAHSGSYAFVSVARGAFGEVVGPAVRAILGRYV